MVNVYASRQDFADLMDLTLDTTNFPKQTLVDTWITASETEIDRVTNRNYSVGTQTETIKLQQGGQVFFLKRTPIISIASIELNQAQTEFAPDNYIATPYILVDNNLGAVKTQKEFSVGTRLKFVYTGGYSTIPDNVRELTLALTKRRYLKATMSQTAGDTEIASIASIRISERSNSGVKTSLEQLDLEIKELYMSLDKSDTSFMYSIGV